MQAFFTIPRKKSIIHLEKAHPILIKKESYSRVLEKQRD
jgi:hypothetical protein